MVIPPVRSIFTSLRKPHAKGVENKHLNSSILKSLVPGDGPSLSVGLESGTFGAVAVSDGGLFSSGTLWWKSSKVIAIASHMSSSSSVAVPVAVPRSVGLVTEETSGPEAWLIVALPAGVGLAWGSSWDGAVPGGGDWPFWIAMFGGVVFWAGASLRSGVGSEFADCAMMYCDRDILLMIRVRR